MVPETLEEKTSQVLFPWNPTVFRDDFFFDR